MIEVSNKEYRAGLCEVIKTLSVLTEFVFFRTGTTCSRRLDMGGGITMSTSGVSSSSMESLPAPTLASSKNAASQSHRESLLVDQAPGLRPSSCCPLGESRMVASMEGLMTTGSSSPPQGSTASRTILVTCSSRLFTASALVAPFISLQAEELQHRVPDL